MVPAATRWRPQPRNAPAFCILRFAPPLAVLRPGQEAGRVRFWMRLVEGETARPGNTPASPLAPHHTFGRGRGRSGGPRSGALAKERAGRNRAIAEKLVVFR
jgi:hypothetical protein